MFEVHKRMVIYKLISIHRRIRIECSWCNGHYKNFNDYPHAMLFMYLLSHIAIYFHCFIWSNECTLLIIMQCIANISTVITMILYLLLPRSDSLDLGFNGYLFRLSVKGHITRYIYFFTDICSNSMSPIYFRLYSLIYCILIWISLFFVLNYHHGD